jgi:hypothetical protein
MPKGAMAARDVYTMDNDRNLALSEVAGRNMDVSE